MVPPNTGLTVRVSSLYWQLTGPNDTRDGITPHVPVTIHFAAWGANRDPALEAALARGSTAGLAGAWSGVMGYDEQRIAMTFALPKR